MSAFTFLTITLLPATHGENNRGWLELVRYDNNLGVLGEIHLLLNSGSVECTFETFSCVYSEIVYYHFIFPRINKGG